MFTEDDFIRGLQQGYQECAAWADAPEGEEHEGFSAAFLEQADSDCRAFFEANKALLRESGLHPDHAGHDFWLTRNRHGAGFWDRGLGDVGQALTDAAYAYRELNLYIGDDKLLNAE